MAQRRHAGTCECGNKLASVVIKGTRYYYKSCWSCANPRRKRKFRYQEHRKDHCESCGWVPPTIKALEVDHVVPRADGGTDDPSNLRTLCPNCHRIKTLIERGIISRN